MTDCATCRHAALKDTDYPCSSCGTMFNKYEAAPLPGHAAAVRTLEALGYTYHGATMWQAPTNGREARAAVLALLAVLPSPGSMNWNHYHAKAEVMAVRNALGLPE